MKVFIFILVLAFLIGLVYLKNVWIHKPFRKEKKNNR